MSEEKDMEPVELFAHLKGQITDLEYNTIIENEQFLANVLKQSEDIGQVNLMHKAAESIKNIRRELALNALGYKKYLRLNAITTFIDKVTPKNSVKYCWLEHFPRVIPPEPAAAIKAAVDLKIFDKIAIIYTDFTNEKVLSKAQQEVVNRNKDPIALGVFYDETTRTQHERLFFITDWEDEFCDLTFERIIEKMAQMGMSSDVVTGETRVSVDEVNRILQEHDKKLSAAKKASLSSVMGTSIEKKSILRKFIDFFRK